MLKQIGREIQGRNWIERVVQMARDLEQSVERHEFAKYLREQAEEVEHYVLLADIAEWLAGGALPADRLLGYEVVLATIQSCASRFFTTRGCLKRGATWTWDGRS